MSKQKLKQTGSKIKECCRLWKTANPDDKICGHCGDKLVTSKFEVTSGSDKGMGLVQYRLNVSGMAKKIRVFAVKLSPNLLSVKMALMNAVREVEEMMKERR